MTAGAVRVLNDSNLQNFAYQNLDTFEKVFTNMESRDYAFFKNKEPVLGLPFVRVDEMPDVPARQVEYVFDKDYFRDAYGVELENPRLSHYLAAKPFGVRILKPLIKIVGSDRRYVRQPNEFTAMISGDGWHSSINSCYEENLSHLADEKVIPGNVASEVIRIMLRNQDFEDFTISPVSDTQNTFRGYKVSEITAKKGPLKVMVFPTPRKLWLGVQTRFSPEESQTIDLASLTSSDVSNFFSKGEKNLLKRPTTDYVSKLS